MLFWIFVILLVLCIVVCTLTSKNWNYDTINIISIVGIIATAVISAIMFFSIVVNNFSCKAQIEKDKQRYIAITYKLESGACRDELGLLSKSVIDEIQDWNEDVAYYQSIQRDFWLGIFYPNVYDEFETIAYERYEK